jgi:hypothetical protein
LVRGAARIIVTKKASPRTVFAASPLPQGIELEASFAFLKS